MSDERGDLTSIITIQKKEQEDLKNNPSAAQDQKKHDFMDAAPIETVSDFPSLDQIPTMDHESSDSSQETAPSEVVSDFSQSASDANHGASEIPATDFSSSPGDFSPPPSDFNSSTDSNNFSGLDMGESSSSSIAIDGGSAASNTFEAQPFNDAPLEQPAIPEFSPPTPSFDSPLEKEPTKNSFADQSTSATSFSEAKRSTPTPPPAPIASTSSFSQPASSQQTQSTHFENPGQAFSAPEEFTPPKNPYQPSGSTPHRSSSHSLSSQYQFSLLILGHLTPAQKEKLLDLLSDESFGLREIDLEPQFEAGKILIPRLSEYAGIVIVQALRDASVEMRLALSESIFSSVESAETISDPTPQLVVETHSPENTLSDPLLPLLTGSIYPADFPIEVIDTLTASLLLSSSSIETESSSEYEEALHRLKNELKRRAKSQGAIALIDFKSELISLSRYSKYRLTVSALAIKRGVPASALKEVRLPTQELAEEVIAPKQEFNVSESAVVSPPPFSPLPFSPGESSELPEMVPFGKDIDDSEVSELNKVSTLSASAENPVGGSVTETNDEELADRAPPLPTSEELRFSEAHSPQPSELHFSQIAVESDEKPLHEFSEAKPAPVKKPGDLDFKVVEDEK